METTNEKIYCMPCGFGSKDNTAEMMALMGNNSWGNNPWMYLIFLALFGGNGFGWGNRADTAQNADLSRQLATLQGTVADNHNNDIALQAINGNRDALGQLAQTFNTDLGNIQSAICSVKSAIETVGGQVGYTSESVKNAIALGDANIIQQMQSCCCQNKMLVQEMGYKNELANERQTNILNTGINDVRQAVVNGFANIGYQNSQNTAQIIQASQANTQRILDQMCQNTTQELRDKLAQMSQEAQTQTIINKLNGCGCNC